MKKYKVTDDKFTGVAHFGNFGMVDFDNLTDKQAEKLVSKGFPHLEKVKKTNAEKGTTTTTKSTPQQ